MNDKYVLCTLVEKFGADDFSVWTVDISEEDFKTAMTDSVRLSGDPAVILNGLPLTESKSETVLHFMFSNSKRSEIITTEVDDGFIYRYHDQGCSVRGSLQNILDELGVDSGIKNTFKAAIDEILFEKIIESIIQKHPELDPNNDFEAILEKVNEAISGHPDFCDDFENDDEEEL